MRRNNWTKYAQVLLAAVCIVLVALVANAHTLAQQDWMLQVEGIPISRQLYSYFIAQALAEVERDDNGVPLDMEELRAHAAAQAITFVALNSELRNQGVTLEPYMRAEVAQRTALLWRTFGHYYTRLGIDKEIVALVQDSIAAQDRLFRALYDTGGLREVPEESLESFFYGNFAAIDGLRLPLRVIEEDGSERAMTQTERGILVDTMRAMAVEANREGGPPLLILAQEELFATAMNYAMPFAMVLRRDLDLTSADFDRVMVLSTESVTVLELEHEVIVAHGVDMREHKEEFYYMHRAYCLRTMMLPAFEADLQLLFAQFTADENVAAIESLLNNWDFSFGFRGVAKE
ncbi:MAG: hypothetical protein FWE40_04590 [Oscillospiraceae bacterium]|nr:hypothetical protein [Oscillospiraceae bacterium]